MNKKNPLQSKRKSSAMALMLVALTVLLVMGVGMLSLGLRGRILALQAASEIAARCAADAGLTKALFEMNEKLKVKPWSDSNLPQVTDEALPNCDAIFSYTVTGDSSNGFTVESVGNYSWAQRKVNSTLRLQTLFEYAVFTQGSTLLKTGTTIDMCNFNAGDPPLQIGTNSTEAGAIVAKSGVTIDGDVVVGMGGDPEVVIDALNEAAITGSVYVAPEEYELPSITVPQYLQELPSQGTLTGGTTITTTGKYDNIDLGNSEIAAINGAVSLYVTGNIILDNSAEIQIVDANTNPDASLIIYLGGDFLSQNGGIVNNLTRDATRVKIYGLDTCLSFNFKTNSIFHGAIYAPNADVRLHNSVEVYGSIITNSFIQDVRCNFHYDASLRDATVSDEAARFVVKRWHEE